PQRTHIHCRAHEAHAHRFASAGALAFVNAYAGSAASPALLSCLRSTSACLSLLATLTHAGRRRMTPPSHDPFAAFVGRDWADATHAGCLQAAGAATRECVQREPTPAASDAWVPTRRTRLHGHPVALCLARTQGPLGCAWRTDDLLMLFPIHPLTLARS